MTDLDEWDRVIKAMTPGEWKSDYHLWIGDYNHRGAWCITIPHKEDRDGIAFLHNNSAALVEECRRLKALVQRLNNDADYAIKSNLQMCKEQVHHLTDVVLHDKVQLCEICRQTVNEPGRSKYCGDGAEKREHKWIFVARTALSESQP